MEEIRQLVDKLYRERDLSDEEYQTLLSGLGEEFEAMDIQTIFKKTEASSLELLFSYARKSREEAYGKEVYLRGLIEFTNVCKNDCYYCGIRAGNSKVERYRLTKEEILDCAREGYELGFRTIVLQGGEDPYYTDEMICDIVSSIKELHPDCAVTLSIGEKERASYEAYFKAGADRYLLRHETANEDHYRMLHPANLSGQHRRNCLLELKEIGYQVGCGIMVGAPGQNLSHIVEDIRFMQKLGPHMIGIGPFIPHSDTPFAGEKAGTLKDTLLLLAVLRLTFPNVLLPATTALGTIHPKGRELGMLAGANVVMPNLSPRSVRNKYLLYDGKICTGDEAAQCHHCMEKRMESVGYVVVTDRGDYKE